MAIADKLTQIAENEINVYNSGKSKGYTDGFEEGKQAEYDAFWDAFQQNGNRTNYTYAFATAWTDEIYNPKYPIKLVMGNGIFNESKITDVKVPLDFTTYHTNQVNIFSWAYYIKTIPLIKVIEDTRYNSWFTYCDALENITFEGSIANDISFDRSTKLSADSIRSIIEHLSDTASGKTLTLSQVAVDKAFEEGEGANNGSQTQEWEWYLGTKPNWTISLA